MTVNKEIDYETAYEELLKDVISKYKNAKDIKCEIKMVVYEKFWDMIEDFKEKNTSFIG